jgi:hypothetical protein
MWGNVVPETDHFSPSSLAKRIDLSWEEQKQIVNFLFVGMTEAVNACGKPSWVQPNVANLTIPL